MVQNTLQDIRTKVRRLTARESPSQITDAEIDNYVNTYYLFDFPESLRTLTLTDTYSFYTQENQEVYPFDNNQYFTLEPPCYVAGQQVEFFSDRDAFYRTWPKPNYIQVVTSGNGTVGPYTGTLSGTPFLRSVNATSIVDKDVNVIFGANLGSNTTPFSTAVRDDGAGGMLVAATGVAIAGTINYSTGVFSITFPVAIPAGEQITASYIPFTAAQPRCLLFAQNQIFLRPVPDGVYNVDVTVERQPTELLLAGTRPELDEWWQLLAFGAARKILIDNGDYENLGNMQPYFEEQLLLAQRRTLNQLTNQRASTIYGGSSYPYSNLYPYI